MEVCDKCGEQYYCSHCCTCGNCTYQAVQGIQARVAELEKDVAFYRCCALSGEIPDDAQRPSLRESKDE